MMMDRRQLLAMQAMIELNGLAEIPGEKDHPWITKAWQIVGASWYDDDETPWCGASAGRVIKEAGLPILDGGMSVQARAWHDKGWGVAVPLDENTPRGALIVLKNHVAFLDELVIDRQGKISGYYLWGGNQSNRIGRQFYRYKKTGANHFLSARVWPSATVSKPKPPNPFTALVNLVLSMFGSKR